MWNILSGSWSFMLCEASTVGTCNGAPADAVRRLREAAQALKMLPQGDRSAVPRARALVEGDSLQLGLSCAGKERLREARALVEAGQFQAAAALVEGIVQEQITTLEKSVMKLQQAALTAPVLAVPAGPYQGWSQEKLLKRFIDLDRGWTTKGEYAEMRRLAAAADLATRAKMIEQLMSGYTSGDAEACLHDILRDARGREHEPPQQDFRRLLARVDQTWLTSELDGQALADAKRWIAQSTPREVDLGQMSCGLPFVNQHATRADGTQVSNSCGTSSLAMVMQRFLGQQPEAQVHNIDRAIRPQEADIFTPPKWIVNYMNSNGLRAGMTTGGTPEDLKNYLDKGVPVICLIDGARGSGAFSPHYVVVKGYRSDASGQMTEILLSDPGGCNTLSHPVADFLKWWSKPGGAVNLYERALIAGVPREGDIPLPDGQTMPAAEINVPSQGLVEFSARVADQFGGVAAGAAKFFAADIPDGFKRFANVFVRDSSDDAAARLNRMGDAAVRNLPAFGRDSKFWYLEQCLWGITGDEKEQAILKLLRNSSADDLVQVQQNLYGGFAEIYDQVADGGDQDRGAEILQVLARGVKERPALARALEKALARANARVRERFLGWIMAQSPPLALPEGLLRSLQPAR